MANRNSGRTIILAVVVVVLLILIFKPKLTSRYQVYSADGFGSLGGNSSQTGIFGSSPNNSNSESPVVPSSIGVSSSLLPKEIPSQEDFGSFAPDAILTGQSYLDPRSQIGYPETTGGVLRNANYDVRSEPLNPRQQVSIWQNSTIVPDMMRPQFEIGR